MNEDIYKERIIEMIKSINDVNYIEKIYNFIIMYYLK